MAHCQSIGILIDKVKFAVDQNPQKVGKRLPGSRIKIIAPSTVFELLVPGDYILVANPAYAKEISDQVVAANVKGVRIETI